LQVPEHKKGYLHETAKFVRSTKIEELQFLSSDRFCVVRQNFAVSCKYAALKGLVTMLVPESRNEEEGCGKQENHHGRRRLVLPETAVHDDLMQTT
jgi:hypothetical protein